jgi:radical SAM superfamily enzyme YgiQ (UPF0313 family)
MRTIILNVPRLEPHRPPPGPAIIANICKNLGHEVTAYDLNIKFYHFCKISNVDYYNFDSVWDKIIPLSGDQEKFVLDFIEYHCQWIAEENFDYIMIGIFGQSGHVFGELFLKVLRSKTSATIVIGGMGVGTYSLDNNNNYFGYKMKQLGLVDYFVVGEGEESIKKVLNNETGPGINNSEIVQIDDLDSLPIPDYSFYNLNEYDYLTPNTKEIYITGSRGCVRKCTYCDVERFWPKYRYRSGENIANEIIHNYETLGITKFYFTDSLVNGSFKAFNDMCDKLSRYRFDKKIQWSGQFIFRNRKSVPKDHYKMVAESGADTLFVGIETGSDKIRYDMGKKFTNEDIDFQLEECYNYNIKVAFLMFSGYVTETLEDHYENLKTFSRWQKYVATGTINGVELGTPLSILTGTPLERMIDEYGMIFMTDQETKEINSTLWQSTSNPDLTIKERIRRKLELHEEAMKYYWPVWRQQSRLMELKNLIVQNKLYESNKVFYRMENQINTQVKKIIPIST